jgi:hypothetical protein
MARIGYVALFFLSAAAAGLLRTFGQSTVAMPCRLCPCCDH